jgi:hypothetical protein
MRMIRVGARSSGRIARGAGSYTRRARASGNTPAPLRRVFMNNAG